MCFSWLPTQYRRTTDSTRNESNANPWICVSQKLSKGEPWPYPSFWTIKMQRILGKHPFLRFGKHENSWVCCCAFGIKNTTSRHIGLTKQEIEMELRIHILPMSPSLVENY